MQYIREKVKNMPLLAKALLAFISIVLGLSFLFAPQPKPVSIYDISFATTSSSKLYFKNVRSYYYDIIHDNKSRFTFYKLKRRSRDTLTPLVQFEIIDNPLADEAYLYAKINPLNRDSLKLVTTHLDSIVKVKLSLMNNEAYYKLGAIVYRALIHNNPVYLTDGNDTIKQLYTTKLENLNAEIVLEDYFKLVSKN